MLCCFDPDMVHAVNEYRTLEGDLRRALDDGDELEVHFQPKFSCESLAIVGFGLAVKYLAVLPGDTGSWNHAYRSLPSRRPATRPEGVTA